MTSLDNTMTPHETTDGQSAAWSHVVRAGLIALILGAVGNAVAYFAADAAGAIPETVLAPTRPITLVPILMLTVVGTIGGTLVYGLLLRWSQRSLRTWTTAAVVVLSLAVIPTFTIGAPAEMIVALNLMHLVVAASLWWSFRRM